MPKPTKLPRILGFPSGITLSSGWVERFQEADNGDERDYILDYQALEVTLSTLSEDGAKIFERVEGTYKPQRLRFFNVQTVKCSSLYERLELLPQDHASRSLRGALRWQPPDKPMPFHLLYNGGDEPGSCLFFAQNCKLEKRTGRTTATVFSRDWSPAPTLLPGFVPEPKQLHRKYGGDPITIHLGKRPYHERLFIGGLDVQPEQRPEVNAVLNLGEECSRWAMASESHPADRWAGKGEGNDGMLIDEIISEAEWVIKRLRQRQKVLVHCVAGFNRSATICCAILMLLENLSAEAALARVRQHHPWALPDSHHWLLLRWLAQKLQHSEE